MANTMYGIGAGNMLYGTYLDGWFYGPTGYDGIWNAGDGDQSATEGGEKAPDDRFSARSSEVVRGTANDDFFELYRHFTTSVDTYGGDDSVHVYGSGDYNVDTGADDDDLVIATTGEVEANLGSGDDLVRVVKVGDHMIEGGSGEDTFQINATLNSPDYKWIIDLAAGTLEQSTHQSNNTKPEVNPTTHFSGFEIFKGSNTDDRFIGTDQRDKVYGRDGDDYLDGRGGNDFFRGGNGDDEMSGREGDDVFHGDRGDDSFFGHEGSDRAYGGTGNDRLSGGDGNDFLYGHAGDDEMWGGYGDDFLQGGSGDDWIIAGAGSDTVYAGDGADRVSAAWGDVEAGDDHFDGGAHGHRNGIQTQETANHLSYSAAWKEVYIDNSEGVVSGLGAGFEEAHNGILMYQDTFVNFQSFAGGHGDDTFRASSNGSVDEWFRGNQGDDLFLANAGNEHFNGSHKYLHEDPDGGNDTVDYRHFVGTIDVDLRSNEGTAQMPDQVFWGYPVAGTKYEHTYRDIENITGSDQNDRIHGDDKDNVLEGRKGFDILTGDGGADSFVFDGAVGRLGHDRIVDFEQGEDVLVFEDMRLTSSQMIGGFDDLDTNGDGVINNDDTSAISFGGDTYLMMHSAIVELLDVTDLTANDFVFA